MDSVERMLGELREEVRRLAEKIQAPLPPVLTKTMAAKALSIGQTKLKNLVRAGAIQTCEIGKTQMVPLSEIYRLAQPGAGTTAKRRRTRRATQAYDAKAEAERLRAALRKKN